MSQPQYTTLVQQPINGRINTSSVAVPTGNNSDTGIPFSGVTLGTTMSNTDALNAANTCLFYLYASYDGGLTYEQATVYSWVGGTYKKDGVTPNVPNWGQNIPSKLINGVVTLADHLYALVDTQTNSLNMGVWFQFA